MPIALNDDNYSSSSSSTSSSPITASSFRINNKNGNKNQVKKSTSFNVSTQKRCQNGIKTSSTASNCISNNSAVKPNTTKCPHVILIGDVFIEDIESEYLIELQKEKLNKSARSNEENDESSSDLNQSLEPYNPNLISNENIDYLTCDECDKCKNLWLCLRDSCMYIGCGEDENSNKHANLHALRTYHPLSMNLATKFVWCEICKEKINLETNNPPFRFKSRLKMNQNKNNNKTEEPSSIDDSDFINYLNTDQISSTNIKNDDYYDNLNQFGQYGLDNLGNTCYMNAALQALSNCYAFTSYFIECGQLVNQRVNSLSLQNPSANRSVSSNNLSASLSSVSLNYMKLMKEMWLKFNRNNVHSITPSDLVHAIKFVNPMFRGYHQHDSQEFLIYLMDQIHEELKRPVIQLNKPKENENRSSHSSISKSESNMSTSSSNESDLDDTSSKTGKIDSDSGIASLNTDHSTQNSSTLTLNQHKLSISCNSTDESIDSYETCGDEDDDITKIGSPNPSETPSENSNDEKLQFLDAVDSLPPLPAINTKKSQNDLKQKSSNEDASNRPSPPVYSSIVSDLFNGKIISQVQCLECLYLSATTETFQHLSLPIPSKEYIQALHNKIINKQSQLSSLSSSSSSSSINESNSIESSAHYQGWFSWIVDVMRGYIWNSNIKLSECLTAFFSDDDLKGDNMYSCEKCKKLTNGVKYSRILNLPEILVIHLKRFRHDSMFSTGKISSFVSFPLDNLNMQPFVHKDCKNEITQYDLCSVICHSGGVNGGHYTSFARNYFNEEWYEYDDSYCRQVDSLTVQNSQAYVLFYKKKNIKTDSVKEALQEMFRSNVKHSLSDSSLLQPYYISKQWLHKLKYYGEPGPIDNSDFLCKHNLVLPDVWKNINSIAIMCSNDTWNYLCNNFGIKYQLSTDNNNNENNGFTNTCNYLYPCKKCQLEDELLKQRQFFEKSEFIRLKDKWNFQLRELNQMSLSQLEAMNDDNLDYLVIRTYAISSSWFKEWKQFVEQTGSPLSYQIPDKINNLTICQQPKNENKNKKNKNIVYQLNKTSNYFKISEEMWRFLHDIYGGGPELLLNTNYYTTQNNFYQNSISKLSKLEIENGNLNGCVDTHKKYSNNINNNNNNNNQILNKNHSQQTSDKLKSSKMANSLSHVHETRL